LRIAAWTGRQAEIRHEANQKGKSLGRAEKVARTAQANELVAKASRVRNRLHTSLTHLAAGIATWEARVDAAYATSTSPYPACDSLLALCDVADAMLKDTSPGLVAHLKHNVLKSSPSWTQAPSLRFRGTLVTERRRWSARFASFLATRSMIGCTSRTTSIATL